MRYVAIEKAKDNMVLAMPIYDSINRVLLATGTIMTRDYIRKLKARGLPGFYVELKYRISLHRNCAMKG